MSGEKKHAATDKKKDDAKEKGQVAVSKDVQVLAKLALFYVSAFALAGGLMDEFEGLVTEVVATGFQTPWVFNRDLFWSALEVFAWFTLPFLGVCALAAMGASWMQNGLVVAPEAAKPSMKKFNPVDNVKNLLSKKSFIQLVISVFKIVGLVWVMVWLVRDELGQILLSYRAGMDGVFALLGHLLKKTIIVCLLLFLVFAIVDWAAERSHHLKNLRMSDQDLKDEHKETQGNPEVKRRLSSERRNLLNSSLNRMSGAKAVVANPTHIAVALDYQPGVHDLPFILAMGEDDDALAMRMEAKRRNIPVIVNVKLARMLYADCEEEEYIQAQHIEMAAAVFRAIIEAAATQDESQQG
ncbi:MAG: EscU/YscU/HrcU family type III secretion system export apparatus switch protein [Limnobacter sp.]|uniref:EscU/YscU/HrcU family type III secretion system export apparatus switch protein n=1 Tax=Limnobacter sp. TaxID=2003368 RepID=UPI00391C2BC7